MVPAILITAKATKIRAFKPREVLSTLMTLELVWEEHEVIEKALRYGGWMRGEIKGLKRWAGGGL